jgi:hypothetical protein
MEDEIIFLYVFSILLDEDISLGGLRNSFDTNGNIHGVLQVQGLRNLGIEEFRNY